jgi:hypothetical protein
MTDLIPLDDDLFEPAEAEPMYGVRAGRYRFPAPPGETGNSWMRMTNLVSAFSDQERLQLWLEWKAFMGLRAADGVLFDEWMAERLDHLDDKAQKELANRYAEKARTMANADAGARRGTAQHKVMDTYLSHGEVVGTRAMRRWLDKAMTAVDAAGLDVVDSEFRVWHPAADGTMGTSDLKVLCRRTGQLGILDWKTQARFWTWQEIAGQLYGYDSAPWVWRGPADDRGRWATPEGNTLLGHPQGKFAGKRVALVIHMPQNPELDERPAELHEVDLAYGRSVLVCAEMNVKLRSVGRSQAESRRPAGLRPPL